jgi:hypothetical protein
MPEGQTILIFSVFNLGIGYFIGRINQITCQYREIKRLDKIFDTERTLARQKAQVYNSNLSHLSQLSNLSNLSHLSSEDVTIGEMFDNSDEQEYLTGFKPKK